MGKSKKILTQFFVYFVFITIFISCEKESKMCINYDLKPIYSLENFISKTEIFEKTGGAYIENNTKTLDNVFDGAMATILFKKSNYFKDRIHFKLNFENKSIGNFKDGKDSVSLQFEYQYFQDSVVIINCDNLYEYSFFLNDECKLEHCVYFVSTFENFKIEKYKVIYTTNCRNKSFKDVANDVLTQFGTNAPDTIGINKYFLKEAD